VLGQATSLQLQVPPSPDEGHEQSVAGEYLHPPSAATEVGLQGPVAWFPVQTPPAPYDHCGPPTPGTQTENCNASLEVVQVNPTIELLQALPGVMGPMHS
jgi:hypothetical protein